MKTIIKPLPALLISLWVLFACDRWIDEAKTPNDTLTFEELCKPGMIASVRNNRIVDGPLVANLKTLNGEAASSFFLAAGAMSGEVMPSKLPNVILYKLLYEDQITSNSGQTDGLWNSLHNFRARAEELLEIQNRIADSDIPDIAAIRSYARYVGNLYAGYAWQLLSEAFSARSNQEAGVWIHGTLHTHENLVEQSFKYYEAAYSETSNEGLKALHPDFNNGLAGRQVRALQTKLYMHQKRYAQAAEMLDSSLKENETVSVIYNSNGSDNGLYAVIGLNALNAQVDTTHLSLLRNEAEKKAIPVKRNKNNNWYLTSLERYSTLTITDYHEMRLIRAELILRGQMTGDVLTCVNDVISTYDPSCVESQTPDLTVLAHLRSVYLFLRGERLADLRRTLADGAKQTQWEKRKNQWMPFPETER